jgi:hypothetical protein
MYGFKSYVQINEQAILNGTAITFHGPRGNYGIGRPAAKYKRTCASKSPLLVTLQLGQIIIYFT